MNYLTEEVKTEAKQLRIDNPTLSVYESLKIAVDLQRNKLYARANVLSENPDEYPPALEAIAIASGYENKGFVGGYFDHEETLTRDIVDEHLDKIYSAVSDIAQALEQ